MNITTAKNLSCKLDVSIFLYMNLVLYLWPESYQGIAHIFIFILCHVLFNLFN